MRRTKKIAGPANAGIHRKDVATTSCAILAWIPHRFLAARKEGAKSAKSELSAALERIDGYEEKHLGEHFATYQQLVEKMTALKGRMAKSIPPAELKAAVDEIAALAEKLPGAPVR